MTGASEALIALTALLGRARRVHRTAAAGVPGGAGAGARLGSAGARVCAAAGVRIRADRRRVCSTVVDASTRVGVRQHAAQSHRFGDAGERTTQAGRAARAARGIPLIVDEVYHPLYHGPLITAPIASATNTAQHHRARRFRQGAVDSGTAHWLADRRRRRSVARRCWTCAATSPSPVRRSPRPIGAHVLAQADAGARAPANRVAGQSRVAVEIHARTSRARSAGRRPRAAPRVSRGCATAATARPLCEALAKAGVLAGAGRLLRNAGALPRSGIGAVADGYQDALDIFRAVLAGL